MIIRVHGVPAPQGSKRPVRAGGKLSGRVLMVESSKKVAPWREAVRAQAQVTMGLDGKVTLMAPIPVEVDVVFFLPRPQSARNGAQPVKRPDLDKLIRSTLDGLTSGGVYGDDSQVVVLTAGKEYASQDSPPGAVIKVDAWEPDTNPCAAMLAAQRAPEIGSRGSRTA